jgi:peptidyl-prolyl cis-trans isomerase C
MPRLYPLGLLALIAVFSLAACKKDAAEANGGDDDPNKISFTMGDPVSDSAIVAIVTSDFGSDTLSADLFRQQIGYVMQSQPMLQADSAQMRELRRSLVEGFVLQHLVSEAARRDTSIRLDTAAVTQSIAAIRQRSNMTEAQLMAQLQQDGLTMDSLRALVAEQMRQEQFVQRWQNDVPRPSAAEMETYRKEQAQEVRAQHIVFLNLPGTPQAKEDSTRRVAQAVLDSVKRGVDFAALARRHSQDGTAATGGDLNFFNRLAPMDEDFKKAAFALSDSGDVTQELVESQFGYHIIRLTGRREGTPMDTAQARQRMLGERVPAFVRGKLKDLVREHNVRVRVNPSILQADLNDPLVANGQR